MGIPDHLTYLLTNLYADQEGTVRTGHETADWFQIGKGVHQALFFWAPKSLQMVTAAMKLKDAYSLEERL